MSRPYTRRFLLGAGLAGLGSAALAEAPLRALRPMSRPASRPLPETAALPPGRPPFGPSSRAEIDDLIAAAGLGGTVGYALADAETGAIHSAGNADEPLPPASVMKAITALYALDRLGAGHRFATRVLGTAPVGADGTLDGDLILAGGGDPVLDTEMLAGLAAALAAAGVRRVTGAFRVWGGALPYAAEIEPGQLDHLGYNPAVSGLNLNFNRVHFEWARSGDDYRVTMEARSGRHRPAVSMARMTVADRSLPVYTWRDGGTADLWTVARRALGDSGARWLPVRRPALYAGDVFRTLAAAHGLTLGLPVEIKDELPVATEVVRHESPALDVVARDMLLYSTNLTAECLGLSSTAEGGAVPASLEASARQMSAWLATATGAQGSFRDHSGLSGESAIAAGEMVRALVSAWPDGRLAPLLKAIPLTDERGDHLRFPRGEVAAKTGTLNFVSTLAGYVTTLDGRDLAFAIFCCNPELRAAAQEADEEMPAGARSWNARARRLQQRILQRWGLAAAQVAGAAPGPAASASAGIGAIAPTAFGQP